MNAKEYIITNQDRFLEELKDLLRIPSVSADPKFTEEMFRCAEALRLYLIAAGADVAELIPTVGNPVVYAEKIISLELPTILVYGHYDVQPADPYELWETPPFEPEVRHDRIYARGACDDKGQMYMHVKAMETALNTGGLACNLKFMIEGEEEVGSANLPSFLKKYTEKLSADVILISDTGMVSNDCPSITTGLRGLSYMEVEVTGPNRDLHSGMYGGGVANPLNVLCQMIGGLIDENGKITVQGFYDDVADLTVAERDELAKAPFDEIEFKQELGLASLTGEKGYSPRERMSIRPTLDVNGIWGGYIGEGAKTVLPAKAFAKISMRLVPNQSADKISELFAHHFAKIAPATVQVKVRAHHGGEPAVVPLDAPALKAAATAIEEVWGKAPVYTREGGSIPIVSLFKKTLELDSVLMGFGLDRDAIHSPNESYGLLNYYRGIETICSFYTHFAATNS